MGSWTPFTVDDLPPGFVDNVTGSLGEHGSQWLSSLPGLVAEVAETWSLRVGPHFPNLSYNFVAPATMEDGREVVFKASAFFQDHRHEVCALEAYGGRGICSVLRADTERCVYIAERLRPGVMLSTVDDDDRATTIAAGVMRALRTAPPADSALPTVGTWGPALAALRQRFNGGPGPFSARPLELAEELYAGYARSDRDILLHGDLHHFNILSAERAPWLAIDPHGVIGPAEYEIGALLRNPSLDRSTNPAVQARRLDIVCDVLGYDREAVVHWAVASAVLSAWWHIEGGRPMPPGPIEVIEAIASLL